MALMLWISHFSASTVYKHTFVYKHFDTVTRCSLEQTCKRYKRIILLSVRTTVYESSISRTPPFHATFEKKKKRI